MASTSSTSRPCCAAWNAWAVPAKLVLIVEGSTCARGLLTRATASPSDTPGSRLKESVTEGSWPE